MLLFLFLTIIHTIGLNKLLRTNVVPINYNVANRKTKLPQVYPVKITTYLTI